MVSKFSDVAVEKIKDDKLGFSEYANGIINTIEGISSDDTPFTIGIFGSWGSGKTSLMNITKAELERRGYKTVFFKSWEYGNEEKPWIPFMVQIVNELFKDENDNKKLLRESLRNIFLFSTDSVLQFYSGGKISTGGVMELVKKSKKASPFKEWSDEDVKLVIERITKIEKFKGAIEKKVKLSQKEEFFKRLWWRIKTKDRAEKPSKGKLVIFIDDLDRIPEKLIDFLNSLKIFLDINGCIFILGCDYGILEAELKTRYKEENYEFYYENYFDKIVQAEFYIPRISEQAITSYLQSLTGGTVEEIEKYTQLVNHSIGGNPRKIKRVVNATALILSVFESKLFTVLEEFQRPKLRGEEKTEESSALERGITRVFTPDQVFNILFDRSVLFKLMCMRERWYNLYQRILSEEQLQSALYSLQDENTTAETFKLLREAAGEKGEKLKETERNLCKFLKKEPKFRDVMDLKTYLTLLEISSPDAGMLLEYENPEKLPIDLFNRYMIFEHINKGKVKKEVVEEKIKQMDWKSSLSTYYFFVEVISVFGYDELIKVLFSNGKSLKCIEEKIKVDSDINAVGSMLNYVRDFNLIGAKEILNKTKNDIEMKIRDSDDLNAIGLLLIYVKWIDPETAEELLNETKKDYADKIRKSNTLRGLRRLLYIMRGTGDKTAEELLNKTKNDIARIIKESSDLWGISLMLSIIRKINPKIAEELLNETQKDYAMKIGESNDLVAIGSLLTNVKKLDSKAAKRLVNETKNYYTYKINISADLSAIAELFLSVEKINPFIAKSLLNKIKTIIEMKIRESSDPRAIEYLFICIKKTDDVIADEILIEIKDHYIDIVKDKPELLMGGELFDRIRTLEEESTNVDHITKKLK
ncbi:MAG: P-loop NTPase fold protein [Candidatus Methanoperedens sp.]|nr:P-loop NTPase fold protein [Candidatus Methanoperedens sp.]MCZ7369766.1 P-loop NTPase fold protein [Candidatus Methanoperedens sp.]